MKSPAYYLGADQHTEEARVAAGSKPVQRPQPLLRADALAYVLFERPELERQVAFLEDFGMQVAARESNAVYLKGHGESPWFYGIYPGKKARFLGAGYTVTAREDLQALAAESGSPIENCEGPGGGERVRLRDPDGFIVDLVYGRAACARTPARNELFAANTPFSKPRINAGVRSSAAPAPLEKLGHMVLAVSDFDVSAQWYMRHLGLIPTDVQCVADGSPVLAFCRLDRGTEPADHHTLVLLQHFEAGLMHSAYETLDIDTIGQGAQHLHAGGWRHFWGIGRHVLGSQIFDYWLDPYGDELEHYADGDVFTADDPTRYHPFDRGSLWSWGADSPPLPAPGPWTIIKLLLSGKLKSLPPATKLMRAAFAYKPRPWLD